MWIARDSDGSLWLYTQKPVRVGNRFNNMEDIPWTNNQIDEEFFDEVTWDNSPVELKLMLNN